MKMADPTFEDIWILLDLVKRRFVCLSQKVDSQLDGPLCPVMDCKMDIPTDDGELPNSDANLRRSSATNHATHFGQLPFSQHSLLF